MIIQLTKKIILHEKDKQRILKIFKQLHIELSRKEVCKLDI